MSVVAGRMALYRESIACYLVQRHIICVMSNSSLSMKCYHSYLAEVTILATSPW